MKQRCYEHDTDEAARPADVGDDSATRLEALREQLAHATDDRRRAECSARIQSDAIQRALDFLVRESDIDKFFKMFMQSLVEESESCACGVWLLDDQGKHCNLWMAFIDDHALTRESAEWDRSPFLASTWRPIWLAFAPGWTSIVEYMGDDDRLPESVREFHRDKGVESIIVAPLVLSTRNLGWVSLSNRARPECEASWRRAVLEAMARQATLALHQSRMAEQSRLEARRQGGARRTQWNRPGYSRHAGTGLRRHPDAAAGGAAILSPLPAAVAKNLETAVELARTHMVEARRSVRALRPHRARTKTSPRPSSA